MILNITLILLNACWPARSQGNKMMLRDLLRSTRSDSLIALLGDAGLFSNACNMIWHISYMRSSRHAHWPMGVACSRRTPSINMINFDASFMPVIVASLSKSLILRRVKLMLNWDTLIKDLVTCS